MKQQKRAQRLVSSDSFLLNKQKYANRGQKGDKGN